jgi:hypothetical protein
MHHAQQLDAIRQMVCATFASQRGEPAEEIEEKILIRDGFYCGRCFNCDGFRATWFIEECEVKFYGPDGQFLFACSTESAETQRPMRRVA